MTMPETSHLTESERADLLRDRESRPAVNPRYDGMTAGEVARALLRPKSPEAREALDRLPAPGSKRPLTGTHP